jgi:hypothetical protein
MEPSLPLARLPELLAYEAPFLTTKLLKLKIVRAPDEARLLLDEVKKYLVLCEVHRASIIPMFSRRVDEVWHQFVLFTAHYEAFAHDYFGKFVHHDPVEAEGPGDALLPEMTFAEFRAAYEALFGALPDAWLDELSVTPASRLLRATWGGAFAARVIGEKAELVVVREAPGPRAATVLCRVDARAAAALDFVTTCDVFLARELPGLEDAERVDLCRALVKRGVLFVAP